MAGIPIVVGASPRDAGVGAGELVAGPALEVADGGTVAEGSRLGAVAGSAEARHGPLRATYLISVAYLAHLEFLAGLSTTDQSTDSTEWGRLGAYLVISALLQVLGSLSANESARAIEDGTRHRYGLRHRFGESLLAQAARGAPS